MRWLAKTIDADGIISFDVVRDDDERNPVIECQCLEHAERIAGLLNELEAGPDMNCTNLQPWQRTLLNERDSKRK